MKLSKQLRRRLTVFGVATFLLILGIWLVAANRTEPIDSYAACAQAGYPIEESYPSVCRADGRSFTGPLNSPQASSAPIISEPFELLVDADSHGSYPRGWQVITTQAGWVTFWGQIHASVSLPPLISVDFAISDVVALSDGPKPTAGYRVEVTAVNESPTGSNVRITETIPKQCVEPQHVTNPYYLVSVPKLVEPVTFTLTTVQHQC